MALLTQAKIFGPEPQAKSAKIRANHEVTEYSISGFEKRKIKAGDFLDDDIVIPDSWNQDPMIYNVKPKHNTDVAGVVSGHEDRFEFHNYNSKVIIQKSDSEMGDDPPFTTKNKLNAHRRTVNKKFAETQIENWHAKNPYFVDQPDLHQKSKKNGNRPQTVKQRNKDKASYFRLKNGLNKHGQGINLRNSCHYGNHISLKYVENPKAKTSAELSKLRLNETRQENSKIKAEKKLEDFDLRIKQRENSYFRMNHHPNERKTRSKMVPHRTDRENVYNKKHFKPTFQGVNGPDIPSFYQHQKEWWKCSKEYVESPVITSQAKLKQNAKLGGPCDNILLADYSVEEAPQQAFKDHIVMRKSKKEVTEKPNANRNVKKTKKGKRQRSNYIRWSDKQGKILSCKGRYFNNLKAQGSFSTDYKPLFSSFNKEGIFIPPPSSKDALKQQLDEQKRNMRSNAPNSGNNTHRISASVAKKEKQKGLLPGEQTMFKALRSSYLSSGAKNAKVEASSVSSTTKPNTAGEKGRRRCVSIRSGAFQF
ncbi:unnamed protein product [Moneuplotes crassus]|uniref:Uncharacterized protein n=2 Tax=Euplotes crassus TaxID=5936 RepID=A0AAD1UBE9_EUPCR|nr:unnamed protein product [Moneuplotes crassus]